MGVLFAHVILAFLSSSVALTSFPSRRLLKPLRALKTAATTDIDTASLKSEITTLQQELIDREEKDRQATFAAFDQNKDGGISDDELMKGLYNKFGVDYPKQAIMQAIIENDSNKSGLLEEAEFDLIAIRRLLNSERILLNSVSDAFKSIQSLNSKGMTISEMASAPRSTVYLYNDPKNKRAQVEAALAKVFSWDASQANKVMMKAHRKGKASCGEWDTQRAKQLCSALRSEDLIAQVEPVVASSVSVIEEGAAEVPFRILASATYLLPLLDGAGDFGKHFLVDGLPLLGAVLAPLISLYNAVPFLGLGLFILFSTQSQNKELPRLLRFNMQQAMLLDIALFVPGLVQFLPFDESLKSALAEPCSDIVFVSLFLIITYTCLTNIITGKSPDKLPFISKAATTSIDQQFDQ